MGPINITLDIHKSKSIRQTMQPHNSQRNENHRPVKRDSYPYARRRIGKHNNTKANHSVAASERDTR
jgi:hypothetical protein